MSSIMTQCFWVVCEFEDGKDELTEGELAEQESAEQESVKEECCSVGDII